ncbi:MAG: LysR family transcriptional regulator [bacterium]|nr:LysR family transcriptional regulator [bacterium]
MELRQFTYFVAVAEELHFSRAAKRLHMTQPPLSRQIQRLENELGLKLFKRTQRSVRLTKAGETFLEQARAMLAQAERTKDLCRRTQLGEVGELKVGLTPIDHGPGLIDFIRRFRESRPDVHLTLLELPTNEQLKALHERRIDAGFLQTYEHELNGLRSIRVLSKRYWLAVPEDHELARFKRIPIAALEDVNFILPSVTDQPGIMRVIIGSCRQAGFNPRIDIEARVGKQMALTMVAGGLGVTPCTRLNLSNPLPGVAYRKISVGWPRMEITFAWKPDETHLSMQRFVEIVRKPTT